MSKGYVLVTGASGGIGAAVAFELSRDGYDLILHYKRNRRGAEETAEKCRRSGSDVVLVEADLSSSDGVKHLCSEIRSRNMRLAGIVNNAGAGAGDDLAHASEEKWDRVLNLNARAPLFLVKNLLDMMDEGASIVNMSSAASITPLINAISYSASKAALSNLTKALARTLAPSIRVNAVAPGFIETEMTDYIRANGEMYNRMMRRTPLGRMGRVEEVAKAVRFLISDESSYMTGHVLVVDGGITI